MPSKAQGALEYLLIMGGSVLIASLAIFLLTSANNPSAENTRQAILNSLCTGIPKEQCGIAAPTQECWPEDCQWNGNVCTGEIANFRSISCFGGKGMTIDIAGSPQQASPEGAQGTQTSALVANAGPDKTITLGGSTTLDGSASGGKKSYKYSWTPTTGLSSSTSKIPTASPTTTTTYTLTVTDRALNTATDTVTVTVQSTAGTLSVTPATGLNSAGNLGGPFSPSSQTYTLINTGGTGINWTAAKTQSWLTLSGASGTLAAGASTTVTVSINSNANTLIEGDYYDTITFTNTTNGNGNTTRTAALMIIIPTATLAVIPAGGLNSAGAFGGPFNPNSQAYTLVNLGTTSLNWTATKTAAWTTLSKTSGTLAAAGTDTVTAAIGSGANTLPIGTYSDTVAFTANGNSTTRNISLNIQSIQNCGNSTIQSPEVCDSSNLNSKTCVTQGFASGTLTCNSDCYGFNTSACVGTADSVVRSLSSLNALHGTNVTVSLRATVGTGHTYYAIDEVVPTGWTIANLGGADNTQAGHLKWLVITGAANTTYTYVLTAPASAGTGTFGAPSGTTAKYMFEGQSLEQQIRGSYTVTVR
ncbi:MAG TPA: hypothetical protein VI977_00425 [archaeon]|nr:hypothetical protein [archaeon]